MNTFFISVPIFSSLLLLYIIFHFPTVTTKSPPARCDNTSTFHTNLKILLSSLSFNTSLHNGFYTNTVGQDPDKAYGLVLCRGDSTPKVCDDCIETAVGEILNQSCPDRSSTKWYNDCMIRYSILNFLGSSTTPAWDCLSNPLNATNPVQFEKVLENLMNNLSTRAALEARTGMFATGESNLSNSSTVYGLAQCIRNIPPEDCYRCLGDAISQLPKQCCAKKQGGRIRGPVCIIWFESYSFYGASTIELLAPSPATTVVDSPWPTNKPPPANKTTSGRDDNSSRIIVIVILAIVVAIFLFALVVLLRIRKKKTSLRKRTTDATAMDQLNGSDVLLQIDFEMIRVATNDFSNENKLGEGGFGPVYKGSLPDGREIAVKRLSIDSRQGEQEFRNEVALVAKLQHRNLVRLHGCCVEGQEKLLIYEYIQNKSLNYYLFDPKKRASLNWEDRSRIIRGIARGLLYLHEDSPLKIIHRDLKPSNILLDASMNPKISDFGMAKIVGADETHGSTRRIAGTFGYMAPEYVQYGQFSVKLDVFSFGVLLLEIVSGQKNAYESDHGGDILSQIWKAWNDGIVLEIIDSTVSEDCSRSEVVRCIHIGLLCVQEDPTTRPVMSTVVLMLTSVSLTLPVPSAPAFFVSSTMPAIQSTSQENPSDPSPSRLPLGSINEVSITELDPR